MLYGFIKEDIKQLDKENPLYIQARYAQKIGKYCEMDLNKKIVIDNVGNAISIDVHVIIWIKELEFIKKKVLTYLKNMKIYRR